MGIFYAHNPLILKYFLKNIQKYLVISRNSRTFAENNQKERIMVRENNKTDGETFKKKINPTFEALVRLKGAMHTNDPKYAWAR